MSGLSRRSCRLEQDHKRNCISKGPHLNTVMIVLGVLMVAGAFALGWRWASRRWLLPCPSLLAWTFDNSLMKRSPLTTKTLDRLSLHPAQKECRSRTHDQCDSDSWQCDSVSRSRGDFRCRVPEYGPRRNSRSIGRPGSLLSGTEAGRTALCHGNRSRSPLPVSVHGAEARGTGGVPFPVHRGPLVVLHR
jgi:hypothetical protein